MRNHWSVAEAKAKLSEIMRLASQEGPQRIGARGDYVLVSATDWERQTRSSVSFGEWLVENLGQGVELEIPSRRDPERPLPFEDEAE